MILSRAKWLLTLIVLTLCTMVQCERVNENKDEPKLLVKRNANQHRGRFFRNRSSHLRGLSNNSHWHMFAPQTPSPDQINCHVEVEVTQRFDGRCVRLGGEFQRAVCQSGIYLDFWNNECNYILSRREARQQGTSASAAQETVQDGGSPTSDTLSD